MLRSLSTLALVLVVVSLVDGALPPKYESTAEPVGERDRDLLGPLNIFIVVRATHVHDPWRTRVSIDREGD